MRNHPDKPQRLERLFQSQANPIYFITFNTRGRIACLNTAAAHRKFIDFTKGCESKGVAIGRYVIMPDHIHCFIRIAQNTRIGTTVRLLKRSLSSAIISKPPHWQPGFFDHVLRNGESYAEKWNYVRMNPVRAGFVEKPEDWPYQGEIIPLFY